MTNNLAQNDFSEFGDKIETLISSNKTFKHFYTEYDSVNKQILKMEKDFNHYSDEQLEDLKKQRLQFKDHILSILEKSA